MPQFLCHTTAVSENKALRIDLDNRPPVAVFNIGGTFHVTDDTCTHEEASLSTGEFEDGIVECPLHAGCFDVATGEAVEPPAETPLRTYPVTIINGEIYVEFGD
tara:strand:- start:495 stop:806 length:312 start_codon:yes stop_codon:yes gene_type:complete